MGELLRSLIAKGWVNAVHDVSDGGILTAVAEMALAGNLGVDLSDAQDFGAISHPQFLQSDDRVLIQRLFSEKQGLFLVTVPTGPSGFAEFLATQGKPLSEIPVSPLGQVGGSSIRFSGWRDGVSIPLAHLRAAHEGFFPKLMGADAALA